MNRDLQYEQDILDAIEKIDVLENDKIEGNIILDKIIQK